MSVLRSAYREGGFRLALARLPGRSKRAIQDQAAQFGFMSAGRWSGHDMGRLIEMAGDGKNSLEIALALGRTEKAVQNKLTRLGLPVRLPPECRHIHGLDEIADAGLGNMSRLLTHRGVSYTQAIREINRKHGPERCVVGWSEDEVDALRVHYRTKTIDELRRMLPGRSRAAIAIKASTLGLTLDRRSAARRRVRANAKGGA